MVDRGRNLAVGALGAAAALLVVTLGSGTAVRAQPKRPRGETLTIREAYIDAPRAAYVVLDGGRADALPVDTFEITDPDGAPVPVRSVRATPDPRDLGVRRDGDDLVFLFDPDRHGGPLDAAGGIWLAGDWNGWQKARGKKRWRMAWDDAERAFVVRVPLRTLRRAREFKFTDRKNEWRPRGGNLRLDGLGATGLVLETEASLTRRGVYTIAIRETNAPDTPASGPSGADADAPRTDLVPRGVLRHGALGSYRCPRAMGALASEERTTFRLFAPTATSVTLVLHARADGIDEPTDDGTDTPSVSTHPLAREDDYTFALALDGDHHGKAYGYRLEGPGLDPKRVVTDPYAACVVAPHGLSLVIDHERTRPDGFDPGERPAFLDVVREDGPFGPEDAVVWELHIRDATSARDAGVPTAEQGRYRGLARRGTRTSGGLATGIDHARELGVTHVQLLPFQAWSSDLEEHAEDADQFNWGYMPRHFFSPEGQFASRRDDDSRVLEAKALIGAMHDAGLRVIQDVVYNHTDGAAPLHQVAPFFYHRIRPFEPADRCFWNGSGCGNELRTEHPMVRKLVVDACVLWAREYGVDGFRFDLMGLIDTPTMEAVVGAVRRVDPTILVWGEPWTAAATPIRKTEKGAQQGKGFAAFNDRMRNAIKGGNGDGEKGWVQTASRHHADQVKNGIEGAVNTGAGGFAADPGESINYVVCHDNRTLHDKLTEAGSGTRPGEATSRRHRLATATVLLSQGIPFLHAGQELERTKGGDHNSYQSSDAVNAIRWATWKKRHRETFAITAGLIAIRKAHPVLRLTRRDQIIGPGRRLHFLEAPDGTIAWWLDGDGLPGERWQRVAIVLNAREDAAEVTLPETAGGWTIVADGDEAGTDPVRTGPRRVASGGRVQVEGLSLLILRSGAPDDE